MHRSKTLQSEVPRSLNHRTEWWRVLFSFSSFWSTTTVVLSGAHMTPKPETLPAVIILLRPPWYWPTLHDWSSSKPSTVTFQPLFTSTQQHFRLQTFEKYVGFFTSTKGDSLRQTIAKNCLCQWRILPSSFEIIAMDIK